jgi:hypothetical protein
VTLSDTTNSLLYLDGQELYFTNQEANCFFGGPVSGTMLYRHFVS